MTTNRDDSDAAPDETAEIDRPFARAFEAWRAERPSPTYALEACLDRLAGPSDEEPLDRYAAELRASVLGADEAAREAFRDGWRACGERERVKRSVDGFAAAKTVAGYAFYGMFAGLAESLFAPEPSRRAAGDHVITVVVPADLRMMSVRGDVDDEHALVPDPSLDHGAAVTVDGQVRSVVDQALALILRLEMGESLPPPAPASEGGGEVSEEEEPREARLVVVESPFAGEVERNVRYARACMLDCLRRGEAPIASRLLYTQCLDDDRPDERALGIGAGLAWARRADATVVYDDLGVSRGMVMGIEHAARLGRPVEHRQLGGEWARSER